MLNPIGKIMSHYYAKKAERYVWMYYCPPKDDSEHVRYSRSTSSGTGISSRDSYNAETVQTTMRSFTTTSSPEPIVRTLEKTKDISFVEKMLALIDQKQLKDSTVYKAAQLDRRLFSKIVSDRSYNPSKDTCIALCFAMKLSWGETIDLLSRAGYTLSHSSKRDVILEYFIHEKVYDLFVVNETLHKLYEKPLGRDKMS